MIYFASDFHLSHDKILEFDKTRANFSSIEAHNEYIYWKLADLTEKDEVYFLGDLAWKVDEASLKNHLEGLGRCKAKLYWIKWNHDYKKFIEKYIHLFERVKDYHELKYQKKKFILMHYPIQEWNGKRKWTIHIHWHQHSPTIRWYERENNRYDVSFCGRKLLYSIDSFIDGSINDNEVK